MPKAIDEILVTVESPDRLDLLQSIQLHGPVASGEGLELTPCWLRWTGFTEKLAFRCSNTAGREPYGPRLYIGRGLSSYNGPLRLGKARAGLGVACPSPAGESDASRQCQILQNLDQFTWVTVDSHSIANIAQRRGVGLISRGSSFGGNTPSSGRREMYACRVQFTGWQVDPVRPRNNAEMRSLGHFRDSHILPGNPICTCCSLRGVSDSEGVGNVSLSAILFPSSDKRTMLTLIRSSSYNVYDMCMGLIRSILKAFRTTPQNSSSFNLIVASKLPGCPSRLCLTTFAFSLLEDVRISLLLLSACRLCRRFRRGIGRTLLWLQSSVKLCVATRPDVRDTLPDHF